MLSSEYMAGFRDAIDVLIAYDESDSQQEFCKKYGLRLACEDSILLAIKNHALAVAEIYQENNRNQ